MYHGSMMPRTPLIAANLKMNPVPVALLRNTPVQDKCSPLLDAYRSKPNVDVVIFPTFPDLPACIEAGLVTGAQFGRSEDAGAFTGDVSMKMIKDIGCTHVLCGHSERRMYHHESNENVARQVIAAIEIGLHPILCVGETATEREGGKAEEIVTQQITTVLQILTQRVNKLTSNELTIAYEPVWAIGTGNTATAEDAQKIHSFIRTILTAYSLQLTATRILYGGSMKPENAAELLAQPDIDGGLIGGASLVPEQFAAIVQCASDACTA